MARAVARLCPQCRCGMRIATGLVESAFVRVRAIGGKEARVCRHGVLLVRGMSGDAPAECPTRVSHKSALAQMSSKGVLQEYPTSLPHKIAPRECPIRVSHKSVTQHCPTKVSRKSILQDSPCTSPQHCPTRVSLQECCARGVLLCLGMSTIVIVSRVITIFIIIAVIIIVSRIIIITIIIIEIIIIIIIIIIVTCVVSYSAFGPLSRFVVLNSPWNLVAGTN